MATRDVPVVPRGVGLPPYIWHMTREHSGTIWGVDLEISDDHVVVLRAYRGLGGRWSWTVILYRITKNTPIWDTQIARGIERTLTEAKPAAEAATEAWLIEQMGPGTDDLD